MSYTAQDARKTIEEIKLRRTKHEREEKDKQIDTFEVVIAPKIPEKVAEVRPRIFRLIMEAVEKESYSVIVGPEGYFKKGELSADYVLEQFAYEIVMAQLLSHPYDFKVEWSFGQVSDYEIGRDFTAYRHTWTISWEKERSF